MVSLAMLLAAGACRQGKAGSGPTGDQAGTAPAPADSAAPFLATPIAIEGRVVDETTGGGISGATVIVLRPGVGVGRWEASPEDSMASLMAGAAVSDSAGGWWIDDLLRGTDYTVMVAARGYRPAVFEDGLSLLADDETPTRIAPVLLQPR